MIFWQHIFDKLQDKQKVYALTVIENFGSSPGRKGFKMLVAQDGFITGSIGGGVMESSLVDQARELLLEVHPPTFIKKQIHKGNIPEGSGMICSGEQTVAFHCLTIDDLSIIQNIINCLHNKEKGRLSLTSKSYSFSHDQQENQFNYAIRSTDDWFYHELIGFRDTLYIIGGGHVGVAVSALFVKLGFYVVVIDNRKNLNTLENNAFAHEKLIVDYSNVDNYMEQGNTRYVAIMTNKYTDDKLVLSKILKNNYRFIGVLGSESKLKTMWEVLRKEGFDQADLNKVRAPIGLSIKSETPEEIAVSIAAQIIEVRNLNRA